MLISLARRASHSRLRLDQLAARRAFRKPLDRIHELARRLDERSARSSRAVRQRSSAARARADSLAGRLESLSPLAVLARGYSLTERVRDDRLLRDAAELAVGDEIRTRFEQGRAISRVEAIES